ncbi:unnamed protein product [Closterium sp. NIES-53]
MRDEYTPAPTRRGGLGAPSILRWHGRFHHVLDGSSEMLLPGSACQPDWAARQVLHQRWQGPPIVSLVPARSALVLSGPLAQCHAALQLLALPALARCPAVTRASAACEQPLPERPCCPRAAPAPRATAAREQPLTRAPLLPASSPAAQRAPQPSRAAQPEPPSCYYCCCCCSCYCYCWWRCWWECWRSRHPAPPSRPAATTAAAAAAAAARATIAAGGGAAGTTGGAADAGGAGPTTDNHCLSWPLSRQLQRLGVDSSGHCLSRTTPPLSSFVSGLFSEVVLAVALGSSDSAIAPGAGETAATLGARESPDALGASASTATGPALAEALHTFTLDSGASRCFFRDCTTVTPLSAPVPVVRILCSSL